MTTTAFDDARLYGQGISFPPRVGPDGGLVWSRGELNVRECLCTILRTRPGERVELPAYGCGLDRYLHEPNSVATLRLISEDIQQAVARWEPRVRVDDVTAALDPEDPRAVVVTISYTLVATGLGEQLQLTIAPAGAAGGRTT
jgi:phage baseplate assembly protein W